MVSERNYPLTSREIQNRRRRVDGLLARSFEKRSIVQDPGGVIYVDSAEPILMPAGSPVDSETLASWVVHGVEEALYRKDAHDEAA